MAQVVHVTRAAQHTRVAGEGGARGMLADTGRVLARAVAVCAHTRTRAAMRPARDVAHTRSGEAEKRHSSAAEKSREGGEAGSGEAPKHRNAEAAKRRSDEAVKRRPQSIKSRHARHKAFSKAQTDFQMLVHVGWLKN